jgi:hypothetical protein
MTNNYYSNYQSGFGNPYMEYGNSYPYGGGQQPFPNSPYPFGGVQQGGYNGSVRNFNQMQQNFRRPAYYYNQQRNFNAYQQRPRRQQPPIQDTFNMLAGHMGTINNGVNMIRQMSSLLGLLR